jgi:AraC-like DNA-binding protein
MRQFRGECQGEIVLSRRYIEKHKMESLSLADVAKASGASAFHLCKVFKKAVGMTFTALTMLGGCRWKTPRLSA